VTTRTMTWAGVVCLVVGPTALLGQALLTPVGAGGDPAEQRRAVPRWAAVAVGAFPIVGFAVSPAGAALAVAGFGACALTLRRDAVEPSPADGSAAFTSAHT
jgi:hypothetical protein